MVNYLKSEFLKQKHRFRLKLLWLSPLIPIALVVILMGGRFFMEGAFNWWYTLILPGTLSILVAFGVSAEKKNNRHGLFSVCINKKKLWISQILMNTILLLLANLIFFVLMVFVGGFLGIYAPSINSLVACFVLFLTFAWQIPMLMFLSETRGPFFTVIIGLICNMIFGIFFAPTRLWYVPFAIPSRLMCVVINVMPNGLPLQEGNSMGGSNIVFIGIAITAALYCVLLCITTLWFDKSEVK